jgi:hypothetical protein
MPTTATKQVSIDENTVQQCLRDLTDVEQALHPDGEGKRVLDRIKAALSTAVGNK